MFRKYIICIFIISLFHFYYINYYYKTSIILIAVISCNRYKYLNTSMLSLIKHLALYEKNIHYNILYVDQGTIQRDEVISKYKLHNVVLMNPSGYSLSFNIIFSYLYTKYILLLEEDWEIVDDIEKQILHPSFIKESILILEKVKVIYGLLLRELHDISVNYSLIISTCMGKHTLYVLKPPSNRFSYTNGACIYRSNDLKRLKYYTNEFYASQFFKSINYNLGFTYKGLSGKRNSTNVQFIMKHIGKNSTKQGICSIWLY